MLCVLLSFFFFFFNDTATTEIYTLSLHDALPISSRERRETSIALTSTLHWVQTEVLAEERNYQGLVRLNTELVQRSEEHTSELQSRLHLVCRLLLEKKKKQDSTRNFLVIDGIRHN